MKVLIVTNHLNPTDGWSRYSCDFVSGLKKSGHNVLCLVNLLSDKKIAQEVAILKNPLSYLSNNILNHFLTARKIQKTIKRFSPDIIHFMVEPYASILPFLRLHNEKTILTIHGTYAITPLKHSLVSRYLSKRYYQKINRIVAVSNFTKNYLLKNYSPGENFKNKIKVINNGVDLSNYQMGIQQGKDTISKILFVGAIKSRKGLIQSIDALHKYKKNYNSSFVYNIIGHFDSKSRYYQKLISKIKELKLDQYIYFKGSISENQLHKYYQNSDLYLMLPIIVDDNFEGFGLVYLEANTRGVPCVGSINSGSEEAIKDNYSGYVVDPFKSDQVAHKIDLILNKNAILSQNCLNWAKQNKISKKTKQLINLYSSI